MPGIDASPAAIPYYAGRTLLRMWIALAFSLAFAISVGYLAARNAAARSLILPALDVLQSALPYDNAEKTFEIMIAWGAMRG